MFTEVFVVVDGALEECEIFHDYILCNEFVDAVKDEAKSDGYPTEIYCIEHDHDDGLECECSQYLIDHHPDYELNQENRV